MDRCGSIGRFRAPPAGAALLALLALAGAACPGSREAPPYDVVLVSIDTLRADHVSSYGYARKTTPKLDAFAAEATRFERAYAQVSFTLPSHVSMLTSLFPAAHGVTPHTVLRSGVPILPEMLAQQGYATFGFYAQDWLSGKFGFSRGFDVYEFEMDVNEQLADVMRVLEGRAAAPGVPFFLFLHLREVHSRPGRLPGVPLYDTPRRFRDAFLPHPELLFRHVAREVWENRVELDDAELENMVARYDGGILFADDVVSRVFEEMKQLGLFEEALVIVTSDHGESLGARGAFDRHGMLWEEGLRIPLLVKLPSSHPERARWRGVVARQRVQSVDLAPSILRINGFPVPESFQGRDLFDEAARDVLAYSARRDESALIRGDYKLKLRHGVEAHVELYDLVRDPGERQTLLGERPRLAAELRASLEEQLEAQRAALGRQPEADRAAAGGALDPEQMRRLEALGYVVE